ncbi:pyruvate dehydrogenase (acetyl-transferring) E1 component subunit alpha [Bacillus marinisedimentorum]|uniref:pyruvate dehydrogenase (acetyl-transferring) E1 component subunit alpha n=1 Tax=Bacillus marinisedimentorum TaxID=1821260 RepID=UPI000872F84D|nr:pyruvate dehydrogenase (acetyl-transferring) E1 component subunit alpha [Bacillus marinisedimentorum]
MESEFPMKQIVDGQGNITDDSYKDSVTKERARDFYSKLLRLRTFDRKAVSLQRQGRIGTYAPFEGQEAAQVGSASALQADDWMFPTYRDHGAMMTFGQPLATVLLFWSGRPEGCVPPQDRKIFPPGVPIATQLPHAAGAAWAEKKRGSNNVSIAYFGDGATSEGDFHEALNFASVFNLPVVFFNQNNGYAISLPIKKQMKSKTIAQKAVAYDIPGVRVDGNDVFAVNAVTEEALERARKTGEPTLIEAVTWRYGAHTTTDDPTKYRNQAESEERRGAADPLLRIERLMKNNGWWDDEWAANVQDEIAAEIELAISEVEAVPEADPALMFDHVFNRMTWTVEQQKEEYTALRKGEVL